MSEGNQQAPIRRTRTLQRTKSSRGGSRAHNIGDNRGSNAPSSHTSKRDLFASDRRMRRINHQANSQRLGAGFSDGATAAAEKKKRDNAAAAAEAKSAQAAALRAQQKKNMKSSLIARQVGAAGQFADPRFLATFRGWSVTRMFAHDIVEHGFFGAAILFVILMNTVLITLQTDAGMTVDLGWYFAFVDSIFLGVYMLEIILKLFTWRRSFFSNGWNNFDFFIVALSLSEVLLLFFLGSISGGFNPKIFRLLRIFRAARAFRALRVLRTITFFQNLQIIVTTLLKSIPAWGSISLLLFMVLYIFAIVGVTLYGTLDPPRFGDIWVAMFTLFQLLTLDDWFGIYDTVKDRDQTMIIFLICFIIMETFIFINLFIAVIVNNLEHLRKRNDAKLLKAQTAARLKAHLKRKAANILTETIEDAHKTSRRMNEAQEIDAHYEQVLDNPRERIALGYLLMLFASLENNINNFQDQQQTLDTLVDVADNSKKKKKKKKKEMEAEAAGESAQG